MRSEVFCSYAIIMTVRVRVCEMIDGDAVRDGGMATAAKDANSVARGVATPSLRAGQRHDSSQT